MAHVSVNGASLYYEEEGTGRPIVFVHGACENSMFWNCQRILSDRFRILAVDLPNHGRSKPFDGPVDVEKYAYAVSEFVAKTCNEERAVLVGHSMGGAIALINAIHYPKNLRGVVLVCTGAKLGVLPSIRDGLRTRFEETVKTIVGPRQFAAATNLEIIRFVTDEITKVKSETASADYEACNGFDVRQKLRTIALPTLIIVGEEDKMTPVTWSTYLKENIPKSRMIVMRESSHLPMLERPSEFNRFLNEFVISLP